MQIMELHRKFGQFSWTTPGAGEEVAWVRWNWRYHRLCLTGINTSGGQII